MNQIEIDNYRFGYDECRDVVIRTLREILSKPDPSVALKEFIEKLEGDKVREHWEQIQKEPPGITNEEYEAHGEEGIEMIREKYYSKAGLLKPRLVRSPKVD